YYHFILFVFLLFSCKLLFHNFVPTSVIMSNGLTINRDLYILKRPSNSHRLPNKEYIPYKLCFNVRAFIILISHLFTSIINILKILLISILYPLILKVNTFMII